MKSVSIVIPIFNEELIVDELVSRIQKVVRELNFEFEFVCVDDGSKDKTLARLLDLQSKEPRLKIVKLSRNWGHQNAVNAGLDHATGDAVILMDGDLEDPPELLPQFLVKWQEGYDVVYGVKKSREGTIFKKILFWMFYKILIFVSDEKVVEHAGIFSLLDRKVVQQLRRFPERNKYYAGLRFLVGFNQVEITYNREQRFAGNPKQTFKKLRSDAVNAFFSLSFLPIRLLTYFGLFLMAGIFMVSAFIIILKVFDIQFWILRSLPGWTSLALIGFFILAIQIIFLGIIGEYIARIFDEVRQRPYYIVETVYPTAFKISPKGFP